MKNIRFILISIVFAAVSFVCHAEDGSKEAPDWQEKIKAEKIAFLTAEMDLTPEEAQAFWPLYNKAEHERRQAFEKTMKAFRALEKAVEANSPEKEITSLLEAYVNAESAESGINARYVKEYRKVLSVDKIARLFLGEENFRRTQINKLRPHNGKGGPGLPPPGM